MAMDEPIPLQLLEFVYRNASIIFLVIMFALICFLPTYLKKLCALVACCLTIAQVIFLVAFTAVFHPDPTPNIFNFIDIFAVTTLLLAVTLALVQFAYPLIGVPAQHGALRNVFVTSEELAQQTVRDLESGAGDLLMIALKRTAPQPPAEEAVVNFKYKVEEKSTVFGDECIVCMEELVEEDTCSMLKCAHVYHRECIEKWLVTADQGLCPSCRSDPFKRMSDLYKKEKACKEG